MKITKFRLFNLFAILLVLGTKCTSDSYEFTDYTYVPEALVIEEPQGIKLENYVVDNQVDINVKLPVDGIYRIKIIDPVRSFVQQNSTSCVLFLNSVLTRKFIVLNFQRFATSNSELFRSCGTDGRFELS